MSTHVGHAQQLALKFILWSRFFEVFRIVWRGMEECIDTLVSIVFLYNVMYQTCWDVFLYVYYLRFCTKIISICTLCKYAIERKIYENLVTLYN